MSTLIVRPPWTAQTAWAGARLDPAAGSGPSLLSWSQPQELPASRELVLVVPAALLSWHQVDLPKVAPARWRAALETLLEDRLLVEPAQVHLALAPAAQAGQPVMVAACELRWLTGALQALEQAGHSVARIVPEFEPGPHRLHLQGQAEQGWLIDCAPDRVQCLPLSHPPQASLLAWQGLTHRDGLRLSAEPPLVGLAETLQPASSPLMPAAQVLQEAAGSAWNLAQFELASRASGSQRLARRWRQWLGDAAWRPARWGLAALLACQVLGLQAWAWQQDRLLQEREQALRGVLSATFPQVRLVIDPVLQMERETAQLARASGQASPGDLPRMLAALGDLSAATPQGLDYQAGELSLRGWQPPAGTEWKDRLARQGYRLEAVGERWVMRPAPERPAP